MIASRYCCRLKYPSARVKWRAFLASGDLQRVAPIARPATRSPIPTTKTVPLRPIKDIVSPPRVSFQFARGIVCGPRLNPQTPPGGPRYSDEPLKQDREQG